jgi:acyl-lipid omega-6 desaturase (Delta-12 desaturase)
MRPAAGSARKWLKVLAAYREPDVKRSVFELLITIGPFIALWACAWLASTYTVWLAIPFMVAASGFLVRIFLIQHDCGHGAFFRKRATNDWVGRCLGVMTFTPYADWKHSHAMHHASSGNLDHRGFGDIDTLTVREYEALTPLMQLRYRLYRNPMIMLGFGPAFVFLFRNRLPTGYFEAAGWAWISALGTNIGILAVAVAIAQLVGWQAFFTIQIPIVVLAATIGVWLFYVQHQFEDTTWEAPPEWDRHDAALYGSSHYDLPGWLRWMTANIGVHHVHHLSSVIPYYRLQEILKDHPQLAEVKRMTFWDSLSCLKLRLWDEGQKRLVSFREARQLMLERAQEAVQATQNRAA